MHEFIQNLVQRIATMISSSSGLSDKWVNNLAELSTFLLLLAFSWVAFKFSSYLEKRIIIPLLKRSKNQFDDILLQHKFFRNVAYLVPTYILYYYLPDSIPHSSFFINLSEIALEITFVIVSVLIIKSILNSINDYYNRFSFAKDHPIKSIIQIIEMIAYVIALMIIVALIFDKSISSLVLSLGTISAVLMLIFKDPILGFVGGMQLIFNKMLSIGDWISMPSFGADGVVLEINLTTVKVQNWDKTIVTLPTYSLISSSFQNWKGMQDSGGRRIKRSINIDMKSIGFCTAKMLDEFKRIQILEDYIQEKEEKISNYNKEFKVDPEVLGNGRRQTNIGVFRAYLEAYLSQRKDINTDMTFMVRQLEPNEKGLPIEIYLFANTTDWIAYEGIQADIFDHILAVIPEFGLRVYQYPSESFVINE